MTNVESAVARPRSPVSAEITARGHVLVQDKPEALGGGDAGAMASELLLASVLACQLSTFHKVAAKRRMEGVKAQRIHGHLHFDAAGDISRVVLQWDLEVPGDAAAAAVDALVRLTDRSCTISKALQVPVEAQWSPA